MNDHIRDLGITMSGDCSFNEHINMRTKQCRQLTGWILRTFKDRDKCVMLTLFLVIIVLPRLEYGCQLWSPTSVNQINAIENIQRKFTKHITGMHPLSLDWRQCGNSLALCYFAVVMELPDFLLMNCKSEFGVIYLRCSPT